MSSNNRNTRQASAGVNAAVTSPTRSSTAAPPRKPAGNARIMWRMLGLAKPLAGWMVLAVVCGVAGFCCATGIPVLASALALAVCGYGSLTWPFAVAVAVLACMAVARGVLHYIEQRCNHYIAFRLLAHVRDLVFAALRRLTPAKLAGADRGDLVSTVTADVELLEVFYAHTISPICIAVAMACVMAGFLAQISLQVMALALAAYALVGAVVPVLVSRASGAEGKRSRDLAGALSSYVLEGLRGLGEVLQFNAGGARLAGLDCRSDELVASQRRLRGVAAQGQAATTGAIMVLSCLQMLLCVNLALAGSITPEGAVLATVATFSSFGPFVALANLGSTLQGTLAAGRRVLAILDEEPQVEEVSDEAGEHPAFGGISAENVNFAYGAGAEDAGASPDEARAAAEAAHAEASTDARYGTDAGAVEVGAREAASGAMPLDAERVADFRPASAAAPQQILSNVSLTVEPGKIVGVAGKSGSGKSTLCRLLMRFWDVDAGRVALSGTDVRRVATSALRSAEAFVEQDTYLFHDSIRDNLLIARPGATGEQLEAACRAASVHDFIMSLPQGYDTMVGELGDTLSGGERQRLGLARAFLHDAPLLLLDEPTSNLDALNEGQVLRSLDAQRGQRAVVLISHRPSTMAIADEVYTMDSGRVS